MGIGFYQLQEGDEGINQVLFRGLLVTVELLKHAREGIFRQVRSVKVLFLDARIGQ